MGAVEEGRDDPARLAATGYGSWTRWMAPGVRRAGRTDWAVHVALWEHGALTAGAVRPRQGQVLATTAPPVVPWANGSAGPGGQLRVVVSRTRPPAFLERLSEEMSMTLTRPAASSAMATPRSCVAKRMHISTQAGSMSGILRLTPP